MSFSYAYTKTGETYEPGSSITKDFILNWRHQTDPKAMPGSNFNASVQLGTSSYYSNTSYNVNQILQNQYTSNISYTKNWIGTPYTLTIAALHSQNTQSHQINVTLPSMSFYVNNFSPLRRKNGVGTPKWYEKITMGYNFSAQNQTSFYDSTFSFAKLGLKDFKNGMKHSIPISASYNVLRFINLSFSTTYTEYWLTERHYKYYNDIQSKLDTTQENGFYAARDFNSNVSISTRIYGMRMFKKGKIAGIRHVMTPTLGMTYTPDFAATPFNYYYKTRLDTSHNYSYVSPYESSIIGQPGLGQFGKFSSNMNFGLGNNLQIKVRSKSTDTGGLKNITLIDAFNISGAYNLAADSFKFSNIGLSFRTNILNKLNLSGGATFDPYAFDYNTGQRLKQTVWDQGSFSLGRFRGANLALGAGFRSKKRNTDANNAAAKSDDYSRLMQNNGYKDYVDFNIPWGISFSYSLNLNKQYSPYQHNDTSIVTQSFMFNGDFNLTPRWKVAFNSGYDFINHQLTLTSFDIYRDLHCWEMRMSVIPFGPRKSYNFSLNVKASVLQDLKLLRRRDYRDATN